LAAAGGAVVPVPPQVIANIQNSLAAIQIQLADMANDNKRSHNSSATQLTHALVFPKNAANQALPVGMWVPRTLGQFLTMNGNRASALMHYYDPNAAVPNSVEERRQVVAQHMGVRLA
jgi:hypothetical protein